MSKFEKFMPECLCPLQHLLLEAKFFISYAIPDTPHWVATEMAKIEYRRREIEKQVYILMIQ